MKHARHRPLAALSIVLLLGCPTTEEPAPTADVNLELVHYSLENEPWEGVEICVEDGEACATSDADGLATVAAPQDAEVVLILEGDATFPDHVLPVTTTDEAQDVTLFTGTVDLIDQIFETAEGVLGTTLDGSLGTLAINARGGIGDMEHDVAGVTATLDPADGTPAVYTNEFGLPSDDIETSSAGAILFYDLPTGTYTVSLSHATRTCEAWLAWPGDSSGEVRVPVREGYYTQASVACPE
jgi:hypothetical protein